MSRPKKIVVDSSVIVKWLNSQEEKHLDKADKILRDCEKGKVVLYAPELAKYEIGNAILYKGLEPSLAKACLKTLFLLPISFVPLAVDEAEDTLEIAAEYRITFYDATFVSLSREIGGYLVTNNPKHQRLIKEVKVISLKDYR